MAYPQPTMTPVIHADEQTRSQFLVRVYQHLALAIVTFVAAEALLLNLGVGRGLYNFVRSTNGFGWMLILGGVMIVTTIAAQSANRLDSTRAQYGALFAVAGAEALIFSPLLHYAFEIADGGTASVVSAAIVTAVGFAGLTAVAMITRKDLSFLRPLVMWGFVVALVLIFAAIAFGFDLGPLFSVAMIGLAGASILYKTQQVVRQYPEWAYVGAAVSLFASLMTMLWYVLDLFLRR